MRVIFYTPSNFLMFHTPSEVFADVAEFSVKNSPQNSSQRDWEDLYHHFLSHTSYIDGDSEEINHAFISFARGISDASVEFKNNIAEVLKNQHNLIYGIGQEETFAIQSIDKDWEMDEKANLHRMLAYTKGTA